MSQESTDGYSDPMLCGHCQAHTPMYQKARFSQKLDEPDTPSLSWDVIWVALICPHCEELSLQRRISSDPAMDGWNSPTVSIVYPADVRPPAGLPPNIEGAFIEAAQAADVSPSLSGVGFRRVLEMACRDKQVASKNLFQGIEQLVDAQDPKADLKQLAHRAREIGNQGAHEWNALSRDDVHSAEALCRAVLEVVYSAPHLVSKVAKPATTEAGSS